MLAALALSLGALSAEAQNVDLDLGDIPPGASVTIEFEAVIAGPVGAGVEAIPNTAIFSGANITSVSSNETSTPVDAAPDLVVSKDSDSTASPGATLVYTLSWGNAGTQDATGVVLTETVPLHTSFDAAGSDVGWSCPSGGSAGSTCTLEIGAVNVGAVGSAAFAVVVDDTLDAAVTEISNTVAIADDGASGADLVPDTNEDSLSLTVAVDADVRLTKTVDVARPLRHDVVTYTLEVTNDGPRSTAGVEVTDVLPSGLTLVSSTPGGGTTYNGGSGVWSVGDLGVGESASLLLEARVEPGAGDPQGSGAPVGAFASGSGLGEPVGLSVGADDLLYVTGTSGDLGRVFRFDAVTGAFVDVLSGGDRLVRPNGVVISPSGKLLVAEGSLDALVRVDRSTGDAAVFASGNGLDDPAGLAIGLGGDLFVASAGSDEVLRFSGVDGAFLGVFASGNGLDRPDGLAFGPDGHLYVASRATDQVLRFDGATGAFLDVFASGNGLDEPAGLLFGPGGDLFVASAGTDAVLRFDGSTGAFREVFASGGGLDGAEGLALARGGDLLVASRLSDEVPAYDGFLTNVARVTASSRVDLHAEDNVATVAVDWVPVDLGDAPDPYPTLLAEDGARHGVVTGASLFLGASVDVEADGQPTGNADGDDLAGSDDEDGVVFTSELVQGASATVTVIAGAPGLLSAWVDFDDDGTWSAGERIFHGVAVQAGPNQLSFAIPAGASPGQVVARFRLASATVADPNGPAPDGEVEDHLTPPILPPPALALVKTDGGQTVPAGGVATYALTASNAVGSGTATGVVISETVPAHTTFSPTASTPGWVCLPDGTAGSSCSLAITDLMGGTQIDVSFAVTVDAAVPAGVESLINQASLTSANAAPASASDSTPVVAAPDLAVSKDDGGVVPAPGEVLVYGITVSNVGSQGATGVVVTETVPAGTSFSAAASSSGWSCLGGSPAGTVCTIGLGGLAAGSSVARGFAVTLADPPTVAEVVNTVSVADDGANGPDPAPSDNVFTVTTALDQSPPTVVSLDADGVPVVDCDAVPSFGRTFRVGFSEPMYDPAGDADADDVTNPANWLVLASGPDEDLSTDACGSVFGDDQQVALTGVAWDETGSAAALHPSGALAAGLYRLMACGSTTLVDRGGRNPLDGDGDGFGGDDFVATFRLDPLNAFANGHLDCDAGAWELTSSTPGEIAWSPIDSAGSSLSGSLELRQLGVNTSYRVAQCVPVVGGSDLPLSAHLELDLASGFASLTLGCRYFEGPACDGAWLGIDESTLLQGDTNGSWLPVADTFEVPSGAGSARCFFRLDVPGGRNFTAHLDRLFAGRSFEIFADGFESGDTSAWSATVGGSR